YCCTCLSRPLRSAGRRLGRRAATISAETIGLIQRHAKAHHRGHRVAARRLRQQRRPIEGFNIESEAAISTCPNLCVQSPSPPHLLLRLRGLLLALTASCSIPVLLALPPCCTLVIGRDLALALAALAGRPCAANSTQCLNPDSVSELFARAFCGRVLYSGSSQMAGFTRLHAEDPAPDSPAYLVRNARNASDWPALSKRKLEEHVSHHGPEACRLSACGMGVTYLFHDDDQLGAIVADVWFWPPQIQQEGESCHFANRVKRQIGRPRGLVDLPWDGKSERSTAKEQFSKSSRGRHSGSESMD
uniref:NTR domain-containing protein n=1 Tax=Macrostomum lignano TaxID=282301 RepID=A0A1I8F994_9PLAT